jgi:hypothetical protein
LKNILPVAFKSSLKIADKKRARSGRAVFLPDARMVKTFYLST